MNITVYIVDDEPMAIEDLEMLLSETGLEIKVIGKAQNGVKAAQEIAVLHPDFVFADINMPIMDGLRLAEEVLQQNPMQIIFILTAYREFEYAKQSVKIGVTDYLLKSELSEEYLRELLLKHLDELEQEKKIKHTILETNLRNFFLTENDSGKMEIYKDGSLQQYILYYIFNQKKIHLVKQETCEKKYVDCYKIEQFLEEDVLKCRGFIELFPNEYCGIFLLRKGKVLEEDEEIIL